MVLRGRVPAARPGEPAGHRERRPLGCRAPAPPRTSPTRSAPRDPGQVAAPVDEKSLDGFPEPYVDLRLAAHRIVQCGLQYDAPGLDGDQVLVPRTGGRTLGEPVELVALAGPHAQHRAVHVRSLRAQHGPDRGQESVRLDRVRHTGAVPVEEVSVEIGSRPVAVPLEQGHPMSPAPQEQRRGQSPRSAADYRNPCQCGPLHAVLRTNRIPAAGARIAPGGR